MPDYINATIGGLIIGLSAVFMMYLLGRITGISGIIWSAIQPTKLSGYLAQDRQWRWLFVLGLPLGALLASVLFNVSPDSGPSPNVLLTIFSGLLVGFGTKLGGGCTSGHGVCGMSRFSKRSIVATLVFMGAGIATVFFVNLVKGWS
ncbi:MAG: YeeE/YedE family protein [Gallionella sp.]